MLAGFVTFWALTAASATPSLSPPGWALVEATCEKSSELRGSWRETAFLIQRASKTPKSYVGKQFEIKYHDLDVCLHNISWKKSDFIINHFAVDDHAYFWVYLSGDKVVPITDMTTLWRIMPDWECVMQIVRFNPSRPNDQPILLASKSHYAVGEGMMKVVSEPNASKRIDLLRTASASENVQLATWAKWAMNKYHPPLVAQGAKPAPVATQP